MRLKPIPEPPTDLDALRTYQRAVPLVPGSTEDCCVRLRDRCTLPNRQVANDWLAFLRALGLAKQTDRGFVRTDVDPTPQTVRDGLREGVLLVPATLEQLAAATPSDPLTPAGLFAATRDAVPRHDRARDPDWESTWQERADRLLRWLALVDLASPVVSEDAGYVAGDALTLVDAGEQHAKADTERGPEALVRAYYEALDTGAYDRLRTVLSPTFVQRRPDRTFEDRDRFIAFMRDDRPLTNTTHAIDEIRATDQRHGIATSGTPDVTVLGRLLAADGNELFRFRDEFTVSDGRLSALETRIADEE